MNFRENFCLCVRSLARARMCVYARVCVRVYLLVCARERNFEQLYCFKDIGNRNLHSLLMVIHNYLLSKIPFMSYMIGFCPLYLPQVRTQRVRDVGAPVEGIQLQCEALGSELVPGRFLYGYLSIRRSICGHPYPQSVKSSKHLPTINYHFGTI